MSFFGINGSEFLILLVIGVLVIGPKGVAEALRAFTAGVAWVKKWSSKLREESQASMASTGLSDIDISKLDIRQYDPRRIIREAVQEEMDAWMKQMKEQGTTSSASPPPAPQPPPHTGTATPPSVPPQPGTGTPPGTPPEATQ